MLSKFKKIGLQNKARGFLFSRLNRISFEMLVFLSCVHVCTRRAVCNEKGSKLNVVIYLMRMEQCFYSFFKSDIFNVATLRKEQLQEFFISSVYEFKLR